MCIHISLPSWISFTLMSPIQVIRECQAELPVLYSGFPLGITFQFTSIHSLSCVQLLVTLWTTATSQTSCPSPTPRASSNSWPLSQWCQPTMSPSSIPFTSCLQSFPPSGSFPTGQFFIRWPKYWSFCFSISPSNEYSGLISFRIGWFDLLAVQGTLKSLTCGIYGLPVGASD